jgi:hypothetical protein
MLVGVSAAGSSAIARIVWSVAEWHRSSYLLSRRGGTSSGINTSDRRPRVGCLGDRVGSDGGDSLRVVAGSAHGGRRVACCPKRSSPGLLPRRTQPCRSRRRTGHWVECAQGTTPRRAAHAQTPLSPRRRSGTSSIAAKPAYSRVPRSGPRCTSLESCCPSPTRFDRAQVGGLGRGASGKRQTIPAAGDHPTTDVHGWRSGYVCAK